MCLVLLPEMEGEGKCTCVRCAQVDQRLCLVDKLQEEMSRLRSTCESDKVDLSTSLIDLSTTGPPWTCLRIGKVLWET